MIVVVKWRIKEAAMARVLALLPELAERTRREPGNVSYAIYQSESSPTDLILHEEYADAAAADAHRRSEHYGRIVTQQILPHLELREVVVVKRLA